MNTKYKIHKQFIMLWVAFLQPLCAFFALQGRKMLAQPSSSIHQTISAIRQNMGKITNYFLRLASISANMQCDLKSRKHWHSRSALLKNSFWISEINQHLYIPASFFNSEVQPRIKIKKYFSTEEKLNETIA
jgi:hypothetical protein